MTDKIFRRLYCMCLVTAHTCCSSFWLWCHTNSRKVKSILITFYIVLQTFCNIRGRNAIPLESGTLDLFHFCHFCIEDMSLLKKKKLKKCSYAAIRWWWWNHFACSLWRNALFFNIINWGHASKELFWSAYFSGDCSICFSSSTF